VLRLKEISIFQFKNYPETAFRFQENIVGICGLNGIGKTNLLDAIYYLCFTRSYFSKSDQLQVLRGMQGFRIEGRFELGDREYRLICLLRENGKKELLLDDEAYEKFSAHIGKFPCVFIAPDDTLIIGGGSEERRRFLDALISQIDAQYLRALIDYSRILAQRNGLLRSPEERSEIDRGLLEVYDAQLAPPATYIFEKRKTFLSEILPTIVSFYEQIAGSGETVGMRYESQLLRQPMHELLAASRERDLFQQRTLVGIHKDELDIRLDGQLFRTMASQGQRKSLLFAMKLTEYTLLKKSKGFAPLLLLDDAFEKLDSRRMSNLLAWVCAQDTGQIFISDTHCGRIRLELESLGSVHQLIEL
jgi:DNA replication and repair protein RecF